MSTARNMSGGRVGRASLEKGRQGRALCRWCNLEVPAGRFTFCSDWCVHEWRLRTDSGYLRQCVLERDKGVCALCGVDAEVAYLDLKRARGTHKQKLLELWGLKRVHSFEQGGHKGFALRARKSLWDADHILPVAEGGGECDLANLRTLCLICHRKETRGLRKRLADARAS
ncbi:MAG TPA: HNH endonuclease [Bryobacteraceae bacterium]|jgi:5-methylcytosine-specific restriction endonuclease McrA|nr:HNH endonuclease [Bryobacteraceae bacterium]